MLLLGPLRNILNELYRILRTELLGFFFFFFFPFKFYTASLLIRGLGIAVAFHMLSERNGQFPWPLKMSSHVIKQQFIHLDPILFFTVCFFGVKMAMIASSKTVFNPFWVKAEHST